MHVQLGENKRSDLADRAVDLITDGYARHGFQTHPVFNRRIWQLIYEALEDAEIQRLTPFTLESK